MGIIGSIRKHSWVPVTIVGVAIVAFIIGDLTKQQRGIPDMGKIGKTTVTAQRFNELTEEMENNYKRQQGVEQIGSDVEYQLREQVWQNLVDETLLTEQFEKLGLTVSAAEMSDMYAGEFIHPYLRQMFTNPETGVYDLQQVKYLADNFEQLDTNMRMQWVELEKYIKKDREQQKYGNLITKGFYMPKAIAQKVADMGANLTNVRVAMMPYQSVSDDEANPTDADFQAYYDKHKAEYKIREELRNLNFIVFQVAPTAEDMNKIQEDVMKAWEEFQTTESDEIPFFVNSESDRSYDSTYLKANQLPAPLDSIITRIPEGGFVAPQIAGNEWVMAKLISTAVRPDSLRASSILILNDKAGVQNITRGDDQAKALADSVEALLKGGKISFEEAAEQYSDDPQKVDNKGDMGWQLDGNYNYINEDIVNTPVNGVFVVKHPQEVGYLVVKVTDKTPANKKYRVAMVTREIVPSETTNRNIYNQANKFAGQNRTFAEMQAAAQSENLQIREGMTTAMSNNLSGVPNARSIVQWAFNEKTELGEVADQVFESDNMFIVVALKDIYKKGYPTLDQLRTMIESQVRLDKKAELLMARADEAKQACNDIVGIATKLNVAIDTIDSVSFNDYYLNKYGMEPKVQATIAASKQGSLVGPVKGSNGVYMIQVDAVAPNQNVNVDAIRANLQQGAMQKARALTMALKDNTKVVDQRNKFF